MQHEINELTPFLPLSTTPHPRVSFFRLDDAFDQYLQCMLGFLLRMLQLLLCYRRREMYVSSVISIFLSTFFSEPSLISF